MYYLIGIKGSGMASLALILKDCGEVVAGSDIEKFIFTQTKLEEHKIPFFTFDKHNIKDDMIVIIGSSFDDTHEEVIAAKANPTVKTYTYAEFLGTLVDQYHSICVSGTHGKTTTTGMLAHMFSQLGPTGYLIGDGSGVMPSDATTFVLESCEYERRFLAYHPDYAIILNVELDHVDYYKSTEDYILAFSQFAKNVKKGIAIFGDEENTHKLTLTTPHLFYGIESHNAVYATDIIEDSDGIRFTCMYQNKVYYHFTLPFFGIHLLYNALGVITIGIMNQVEPARLQAAFTTFQGVSRRFNVEEDDENVYIDDYAHHPTAIKLTIAAAKQKYPNRKIVAIFEPDRFSRIYHFMEQFKTAFSEADKVYLCPFPENSKAEAGIHIDIYDLANVVDQAIVLEDETKGIEQLLEEQPAVYLFMSSKDIYKLKNKMKEFSKTLKMLTI